MSLPPEDQLVVLQRFVNQYPTDLLAVHGALSDPSTPEMARRYLIGALNYAFDKLDIYPDHHKGIGIADDAIVLRIAAKLARNEGARSEAIEALATDANLVVVIYDELAAPLEKLVASFPDKEIRGRTAAKILAHKDTRVMFDADVTREARSIKPQSIGTGPEATQKITELRKMIANTLSRAGLT
jgi:uncharacterized membrane protein YkvA (DUF1232 family)